MEIKKEMEVQRAKEELMRISSESFFEHNYPLPLPPPSNIPEQDLNRSLNAAYDLPHPTSNKDNFKAIPVQNLKLILLGE